MKLDVKFVSENQIIDSKFSQINNISDGGYERGYTEGETKGYERGYTEGEAKGYKQGYTEGKIEGESSKNKLAQFVEGTLTEITAADLQGATQIASYAFYYRGSLEKITIPTGVTSIGFRAFEYCGLTDIIISNTVTTIGEYSFRTNKKLKSINFPDSITLFGGYAFADCQALEVVTFDENIKLRSFATAMFRSCYALPSITIPASVSVINGYAFYDCKNLKSVTLKSTTPPTIQSATFGGSTPADLVFTVPHGCGEAYRTATNWSAYADRIVEEEA